MLAGYRHKPSMPFVPSCQSQAKIDILEFVVVVCLDHKSSLDSFHFCVLWLLIKCVFFTFDESSEIVPLEYLKTRL